MRTVDSVRDLIQYYTMVTSKPGKTYEVERHNIFSLSEPIVDFRMLMSGFMTNKI